MRLLKTTAIIIIISLLTLQGATVCAEAYKKNNNSFIKWVDMNCSYQILAKCYEYDVKSYKSTVHYNFTELLAYVTVKNGNKFNYNTDLANLRKLIDRLNLGETMDDIIGSNKYYKYYLECYDAIFAEYIGEFYDTMTNELKYGIKAYHPIARGYWYNGSDDFGNARNYGFRRRHLGHDIYGSVGTPVIAVEGGYIAELGWNRYGGWRIGIRSHDTKRYYYYAHLRKNTPFIKDLKVGDTVEAGQVVGYLGVTGYSFKENTNMGTKPHLHFGLQLIFDESQVDGNGEIWIDVYNICKFLSRNRAHVIKNEETGDYQSIYLRKTLYWD